MHDRSKHLLGVTACLYAAMALGDHDGVTHGELGADDQTLDSGEYADHHTVYGHVGQEIAIDLQSEDFDPYLLVIAPDGKQVENDDYEGDAAHARLMVSVSEPGNYDVYVTSFEAGETGRYTLEITPSEVAPVLSMREEHGALTSSDRTLTSGEYFDTYEVAGSPGQYLRIDLRSDDFDTYLILAPPKGEQQENDDGESPGHSAIDAELTERGTYRVLVTSYEPDEVGEYVLTIEEVDRNATEPAPSEAVALGVGERVEGTLEEGDHLLSSGEYGDAYEFDGTAGQAVRIELRSPAFDTYLALVTPGGGTIQNDDYEGDTHQSVIELKLTETGGYRLVATSYEAGERGDYALSVTSVDPKSLIVESDTQGRIYGLFAGISDYPGKAADLVFTADDAVHLRDALMAGAGMRESDQITLLDRQVTRAAIREAVHELGRRAQPADEFVFFFSGHGDRIARAAGPSVTDPDALDETLELYDGALTDDELRDIFADVGAGTSLIFIDACFSGGFAKDLISVPGRMGLFSSEEDVTSSVAAKFRAGGYLSVFLADGIGEKLADADRDGAVSAIELSQYVYERYREDVKSSGDEFVRTNESRTGHQHLVVDRGSIGPYDVLFR
jgi:Caspase domain